MEKNPLRDKTEQKIYVQRNANNSFRNKNQNVTNLEKKQRHIMQDIIYLEICTPNSQSKISHNTTQNNVEDQSQLNDGFKVVTRTLQGW